MKSGVCLYVLVALGCSQDAPSTPPDAGDMRGGFAVSSEPGLEMGASAAIDNEFLIVGTPGSDDGGLEAGSVRVLSLEDGVEVAVLVAPEPAAGDRFGTSVALDLASRQLAVGAPGRDNPERDSGAVFLFEWTGSEYAAPVLLPFDGASLGDRFGSAVALSGDVLAVGANGDERGGLNAGALYLFDRDGNSWTLR